MGIYLTSRHEQGTRDRKGHHILLSVASIPKRVEASCPWSDLALVSQEDEGTSTENTSGNQRDTKDLLEVLGGDMRPDQLGEGNNLQQAEDT